jgi:hypothetical protein
MTNLENSTAIGKAKEHLIAELLYKAYSTFCQQAVSRYNSSIDIALSSNKDKLNVLFRCRIYCPEDIKEALDELVRGELEQFKVHLMDDKCGLVSRFDKKLTEDRWYVYKEGITIIVRPTRKPYDILVYVQGKRWAVLEITNYRERTFMPRIKLNRYVANLVNSGFPRKYLVVNFPSNFRETFNKNKTAELNIQKAQNEITKNGIVLVYWHKFTDFLEIEEPIKGWITDE